MQKNINFEIFEGAINMKSGSMPLTQGCSLCHYILGFFSCEIVCYISKIQGAITN